MKKGLLILSLVFVSLLTVNAQWTIDSTTTAGVNMYAASTSTRAVFSNGTEWNIFDAVTGTHTFGTLTIARTLIDVVSYGDKVYFGGGKYGSFADPQYTKTVNVYNNATNTWSTLNLSTNREVGGAGAAGGKILFAGGTGRVDIAGPVYMYNKVDIFDAVTGAKSNGKLSKARSNIAVGSSGNKVVFAGGWYWDMMYSVLPSNNVDIYDASTGIWTKTTLSKKRENIGVATVGNKIIFAGGTGTMGDMKNVDVYDVSTNTWQTSMLPVARSAMRSAVVGTKAYFAGGPSGAVNAVYIYNTLTNTWSTISMPTLLTGFSMSVINNKIYFAGGTIPGTSIYSNLVQIYDPASGTWANEYLSLARTGVAAATVGLKGFFAGGTIVYGYPYPVTTNRVDIYTAPLRMENEQLLNTDFEITIFPNPVFEQFSIHVSNADVLPAYAEIFDLNGRLVDAFELTNETQLINANTLPSGNYIITVTDSFEHRSVKKMIKQ